MTVSEQLRHLEGRPALLAIAVMNGITGLAALVILAPLSFGADADFLIRGARGLLAHQRVADFVFSPLAAGAAIPLTWVGPAIASLAVSLLEAAILLAIVARQTTEMAKLDRVLVGIAVFGFLPVVNELVLGQVTIFIGAGLYPALRSDGWRRGLALGIILATIPKPLLAPALVWMLFRRPKALVAAAIVAVLLSLGGLIVMGATSYSWWVAGLRGAAEVNRHGNLSLWADGVSVGAVVEATGVLVALAITMRDEAAGLSAALFSGLLLAPYTLVYSLAILTLLLGSVRPLGRPGLTAYALPANVLLPIAGTSWLVVGLTAAAIASHRKRSRADARDRAIGMTT